VQEENFVWRRVIVEKYGAQRRGWRSNEVCGLYGVCLWKNNRNNWGYFSNLVSFKVGDGSQSAFGMTCGAKHSLKSSFL
jgi:hypothetical protein